MIQSLVAISQNAIMHQHVLSPFVIIEYAGDKCLADQSIMKVITDASQQQQQPKQQQSIN